MEALDNDEILKLALMGGGLRRRRAARALAAHLLKERISGEDEEDGEGEGEEEAEGFSDRRLVKVLLASRLLRKRRLRRLMLAHLLRERSESEEGDEEGESGEEAEGGDERKLARLLVASRILRRRRVRQALLMHVLRQGSESEGEEAEGEDQEDEGADRERQLAKLLIGGRMARRGRARRALVAHLLREHEFEEA